METPPRLYSSRFLLLLGLQFVFGLGFSSFFLLPKYLTEVVRAQIDEGAKSAGRDAAAVSVVCPVFTAVGEPGPETSVAANCDRNAL